MYWTELIIVRCRKYYEGCKWLYRCSSGKKFSRNRSEAFGGIWLMILVRSSVREAEIMVRDNVLDIIKVRFQ